MSGKVQRKGFQSKICKLVSGKLTYAVFRLERFAEVREFTYLGIHFSRVNANWYFGKCRKRQKKFDQGKSCNYPVIRHGYRYIRLCRFMGFYVNGYIKTDKTAINRPVDHTGET